MVTAQSLQSKFDESAAAIESIVAGVTEEQSRKAPEGEWSIRDVLIHLSGDVEETFLEGVKRFADENTPTLNLTPGTIATSADREKASAKELAASVAKQYREIGAFVGSLSEQQMSLPGKIGFLKQYTGSEDVTLGNWTTIMANMHLPGHVEQLRALAK